MIRPLRDDDISALTRLWRELRQDAVHSEQGLRHLNASFPPRAEAEHWIAVEDGDVVAWSFAHRRWWRASNSAYVWIGVLPRGRNRGLGSRLWDRAEEHVSSLEVERLYADVVGDPAGERFLSRRGFSPERTDIISAVDPRAVDVSELEARRRRAEADGYRLLPYGNVDPATLYELDIETSDDMPGGDAPHSMTFDEWRREIFEQPDLTHEGSFVLASQDEPVAYSSLSVDPESGRGRNEGTGTARAHRRRGLAYLAKLAQMEWAAKQGIERIITDNDEQNEAMLAINRGLGYVPFIERRRFVKEVAG